MTRIDVFRVRFEVRGKYERVSARTLRVGSPPRETMTNERGDVDAGFRPNPARG